MATCKRSGKYGVTTYKRHKYSAEKKCKACGHVKEVLSAIIDELQSQLRPPIVKRANGNMVTLGEKLGG